MKKKWVANVVVVFGCSAVLLAGCGKGETKTSDVTDADVVSILVEGEGWDSVVEYPDYGYWLVQEDGDTGFQIVEKGY